MVDASSLIILVVVIVVTVTRGVVSRSHFVLVSDILLAAYPGVLPRCLADSCRMYILQACPAKEFLSCPL